MKKSYKKRISKVTNLEDGLKRLFKSLGTSDRIFEFQVLSDWEKVVGKEIADHSKPIEVRQNILYLKVPHSVWRNQLFYLSDEIVEKVNKRANKKIIYKIVFC